MAADGEPAAEIDTDALLEAAGEDDDGHPQQSFRDLLGPNCVIKRVDKDRNVISEAQPEEMQHEMMTKAAAQKRLGACAEYVKEMGRAEKMAWALETKDRGNELYSASRFDEASKLYNDCLVALDFNGTEEERMEVVDKLQLPVCTNLAACMIEMGQYARCIDICNIALSADAKNSKAAYRRGLANYRLGNHGVARPDFESALRWLEDRSEEKARQRPPVLDGAGKKEDDDLRRRVIIYLNNIRQFGQKERESCQRMFQAESPGLYADRPEPTTAEAAFDDSDAALDAALQRIRDNRACCPCRRRAKEKEG